MKMQIQISNFEQLKSLIFQATVSCLLKKIKFESLYVYIFID